MTVLITLSGVGSSAGPLFDLYASPDGINFTVFLSGVNKTVLEAGYTATVPDGTTEIKVTSVGVCTNSNVAIISVTPTTSTSTSTSTSTTSTSSTTTTTTTADPCTGYTIGQAAEGGIIAYILQPQDQGYIEGECHGLVAMTTYIFQATWGCQGQDIFQAEGQLVGTGLSNSIAIEAACFSSTAASYSLDIVEGGYNDWYLPSSFELYQLYINRVAIGGFSYERYWSSTQQDNFNAVAINLGNGLFQYEQKSQAFRFRPIRSF